MKRTNKLIVLDIDNTVFNWVDYYVTCMDALFHRVAKLTKVNLSQLHIEAQTVFEQEGSIEYPFLIQELPSVMAFYGSNTEHMLSEAVEQGRQAFNAAAHHTLIPYPDVLETMKILRQRWPHIPIIALTDAPRYVAMWKLNKLGLLAYFDAVYGLSDPRVPIDSNTQKIKVNPEILVKHLQKMNFGFKGRIRVLPEDYEKPGIKGLKTVLMDHNMESHLGDVLWVGDNLRKDVGLGKQLGVHTGWAKYGVAIDPKSKALLLEFSPSKNVSKNVALDPTREDSPQPEFILESFRDIIQVVEGILCP